MMSPYDEIAVEQGLRFREKFSGEVTAISLGSDASKETLRKALAMGVDKAILLKDDAVRDSFGVAEALAAEIRGLAPMLSSLANNQLTSTTHRWEHSWLSSWVFPQWPWS